jgi:hypothetical protein
MRLRMAKHIITGQVCKVKCVVSFHVLGETFWEYLLKTIPGRKPTPNGRILLEIPKQDSR